MIELALFVILALAGAGAVLAAVIGAARRNDRERRPGLDTDAAAGLAALRRRHELAARDRLEADE